MSITLVLLLPGARTIPRTMPAPVLLLVPRFGSIHAGTAEEIRRETKMDLLADRGRRVSIEELNTGQLLAHASRQARARHLDDVLIVDVDSHHYENECY